MLEGALVGFGQVAEKAHLPAWSKAEGLRLSAVAEADPARRALAQKLLPEARAYASLEELLAREKGLAFADIATPPFLHGKQALAGLEAGLHVLCEKPLTLDRAELEALKAAAARSDRALFAVHNWKHAPLLAKLRELAASGAVGRLRHFEWHVLRNQPAVTAGANWRTDARLAGGGILVDHGWHAAYLLCALLGGRPRRVAGSLKAAAGAQAEDEATFLGEYPNGTGLAHMTWRSPERGHRGVLYGETGSIELGDDALVLRGASTEKFAFPEALSKGSAHPDWFAGSIADFAAAIADPAKRRENLVEVEACLDVLEAVYGRKAPVSA
ncbi:MAG TPA: Gfo/Idh/MocA family oxidoreductase [Elusimicrobiota bacterium]|jgi:predicted dehydrogenase|nr:Gfo/Idh/MocA family oxidoreductase [Elusimicrobiota bacterium]